MGIVLSIRTTHLDRRCTILLASQRLHSRDRVRFLLRVHKLGVDRSHPQSRRPTYVNQKYERVADEKVASRQRRERDYQRRHGEAGSFIYRQNTNHETSLRGVDDKSVSRHHWTVNTQRRLHTVTARYHLNQTIMERGNAV